MKQDLRHGGALDQMRRAFPEAQEPWLDLSTGINPWAFPYHEITQPTLRHLPTVEAMGACRAAMARSFDVAEEHILPAPGSELLIRLLPTILKPKRVAILTPTYGDHGAVWRAAPCEIVETADPLSLAGGMDMVVLCNPNNPDGRSFDPAALETARRRLAENGSWLVVDEAYSDLDPVRSIATSGGKEGLIVLRSFGKFFGLAGLRLGALIAPTDLMASMAAQLGVWPVSGPALEIGARAYGDIAWQEQMRQRLRLARARLDDILVAGGLNVVGGTDLFRFVEVENATALWERLALRSVYVRRFPWSNRYLRIGMPASAEEETRLAKAIIP